jgi:hypothetical protein
MTRNVGSLDKMVRLVLGAILIAFALGYISPGSGYNWLGWAGVILIGTAFVSFCPLYRILGLSSCPIKKG